MEVAAWAGRTESFRPMLRIILSHNGHVSEAHHTGGAAGSRPHVPRITDMMFTTCEPEFEYAYSSKPLQ